MTVVKIVWSITDDQTHICIYLDTN